MSALGQKQTSRDVRVMSVLPLKADIRQREWNVALSFFFCFLLPTISREAKTSKSKADITRQAA
jgi:hypothetical protein